MTVPNAFVSISGSHAKIKPTGSDDYLNIQEAIDAIVGLSNPVLEFEAGVFYSSKQIVALDWAGEIKGQGKGVSVLTAGTPGAPMDLLGDGDALSYHPSKAPSLLVIQVKSEEELGGTYTWDGTTTVTSSDASGVLPVAGDYIRLDSLSANASGAAFKVASVAGTAPNLTVTIENPDAASIPNASGTTRSVYKPSLSARSTSLKMRDMTLSSNAGSVGYLGRVRNEVRFNVHTLSLLRLVGAHSRLDPNPTVGLEQVDVVRTDADIRRVELKSELNNSTYGLFANSCCNWRPGLLSPITLGEAVGVGSPASPGFFDGDHLGNNAPRAPMNGDLGLRDCEISGVICGVSARGWVEDRADDGPYLMPVGAADNPRLYIEGCLFSDIMKNTGADFGVGRLGAIYASEIGGTRMSVVGNTMDNIRTVGGIYNGLPPDGWVFHPGYTMSASDLSVKRNDIYVTGNGPGEGQFFWLSIAPGREFPFFSFADAIKLVQKDFLTSGFGFVPGPSPAVGDVMFSGNNFRQTADIPGIITTTPSPIGGLVRSILAYVVLVVRRGNGGKIKVQNNCFAISPPTPSNPDVLQVGPVLTAGAPIDIPLLEMTLSFQDNDIDGWTNVATPFVGLIRESCQDCTVECDDEIKRPDWFDFGQNTRFLGCDVDNTPFAPANETRRDYPAEEADL